MAIIQHKFQIDDAEIQGAYDRSIEIMRNMIAWIQKESVPSVNTLFWLYQNGHTSAVHFAMTCKKAFDEIDIMDYESMLNYKLVKENLKINTIMASINFLLKCFDFMELDKIVEKNIIRGSSLTKKIVDYASQHKVDAMVSKKIVKLEDVFLMRKSPKARHRLSECIILEIALSSGARLSEVLQARCCDIDFNANVVDQLEGGPSRYVGGSLTVDPTQALVKSKKPRVLYFSKLAAKLMKIYMAKNNLTTKLPIPFMSIDRRQASSLIATFIRETEIFKDRVSTGNEEEEGPDYKSGFLDINFDDLKVDVSQEYINRAKNAAKQIKESIDIVGVTESTMRFQRLENTDDGISAHAMRHGATMLHYYRNFYGGMKDFIAIKKMLGHSDLKTTQTYLKAAEESNITEKQWKQAMLGNGTEYLALYQKNYNDLMKSLKMEF